ncbi:hypothetical protein JW848_00430 [Candidatus Bipolaricaulota bacterium]|nr:hypothetical protein [Candidatus Bipolaricaulota bacterium]
MRAASVKSCLTTFGVVAVFIVVLFGLSRINYLLFHTVVELFSIVIAAGIFMLAWNARSYHQNGSLLLLGIGYAAIAGMDLLHTLSYQGMDLIPGAGANTSTQLWIAGRGMESVTLVLVPLWFGRRIRERLVLAAYAAAAVGLAVLVFAKWFPVCYVPGQGLTAFKVAAEYVICGLVLVGLVALWRKRRSIDQRVGSWLGASMVFTIAAEVAFTRYVSVFGSANLAGHMLKLVSFFFIYKAIIETGIVRPLRLLFRDLKREQESLETTRDRLEESVEERTAELWQTNMRLSSEIAERREVEHELRSREQQLQDMMRRVVTAQEEERARLSRELHDEAGQSLTLLSLSLNGAVKQLPKGERSVQAEIRQAADLAQRTMDRIRRLAHGLHPPALDVLGLREALREMCVDVEARTGLSIEYTSDAAFDVTKEVGTAVYRVLQESLANIGKHASAAHARVDVHFSQADGMLRVRVEDDGRGFDPDAVDSAGGGMGLEGMRERLEQLGGWLELESSKGKGTHLVAHIPVKEAT